MKKVLALMLAVVMVYSANACNSRSSDTTEPSDSQPVFNVSVFVHDSAGTYIEDVCKALKMNYDAMGATVDFYNAVGDQEKQDGQIKKAIKSGTDLLIVNIVTTDSEEPAENIMEMAGHADIPVIFFDREVLDESINLYEKCAYVGTDYIDALVKQGELIAEVLADTAKYDINGDGKISYIFLLGEFGSRERSESEKRIQQLHVETANNLLGNVLTYYDPANADLYQACNYKSDLACNAMTTALGTNPFDSDYPIELALSNNDEMALGAVEALNKVGYNMGTAVDENRIPVLGMHLNDDMAEAIIEGKIDGTVKENVDGMANTIAFMTQNVMNGGRLMDNMESYDVDEEAAKIRVPYVKVTRSSFDMDVAE